jgi:hypothetical protein
MEIAENASNNDTLETTHENVSNNDTLETTHEMDFTSDESTGIDQQSALSTPSTIKMTGRLEHQTSTPMRDKVQVVKKANWMAKEVSH